MSDNIQSIFESKWIADITIKMQQAATVLKPLVRSPDRINGSTAYWKVASPGAATSKGRASDRLQFMDTGRSSVSVTAEDWYAPEPLGAIDMKKVTHNEQQTTTMLQAGALGRKIDELIIAALDAGTYTASVNLVGDATTAPNANTFITAREYLNATGYRGVAGDVVCVVGQHDWSYLMRVAEFNDAQKIGTDKLPYNDWVDNRLWMGVLFVWHQLLTVTSNYRRCYMYHKNAVGWAEVDDVKARFDYQADMASYIANAWISGNAKIIDNTGVVQVRTDADIALPA